MVAERVTPSPGDAPPGPDSAFNESGVQSPGSMAPDSAFNESGVRSPGSMAPDSAFNESGVRIPGSMAPDSAISNTGARTNLKSRTPDSGLLNCYRICVYCKKMVDYIGIQMITNYYFDEL